MLDVYLTTLSRYNKNMMLLTVMMIMMLIMKYKNKTKVPSDTTEHVYTDRINEKKNTENEMVTSEITVVSLRKFLIL